MLHSIFLRTLRERRLSTAIYCAALFGFALMFAVLYKEFVGELEGVLDSFPESMSAFLGDLSAASTPEGWLGIELFGLFLPIILAVVGVGFGASAIGREEDEGTLELLLASPVSRHKIFVQKALAIAAQLGLVSLSVWLGVAVGSMFFDFDVSLGNVFFACVSAWLLGLVFGFTALAVQSVTGKRAKGLGIGAGVVVVTYIADVVSQLIDWLEFLKYVSPFYYFNELEILQNGYNASMLVLLAVVVVLYVIAHGAFVKRDTGV